MQAQMSTEPHHFLPAVQLNVELLVKHAISALLLFCMCCCSVVMVHSEHGELLLYC